MRCLSGLGVIAFSPASRSQVLVYEGESGLLLPKISDFGLAAVMAATTSHRGSMRAMDGTTAYQAPEQWSAEISPASDVYSFGIVLWELLHGDRPWKHTPPAKVIFGVSKGVRPPVTVSDDLLLCKLMRECWQSEMDARPSFAHISERLAVDAASVLREDFRRVSHSSATRAESSAGLEDARRVDEAVPRDGAKSACASVDSARSSEAQHPANEVCSPRRDSTVVCGMWGVACPCAV